MKRPDKWERIVERILRNGEFSPDCVLKPGIIRALRRTNAAAEKLGIAIGFERSCVAHTGGKFNDHT